MNNNLRASLGRVLLYLRSRFGTQLSYQDYMILEDLFTSEASPQIIQQFLSDICQCDVNDRDASIIQGYFTRLHILDICVEWYDRPMASCYN